jgi:hypothetical protein
MIVDEKGRLFKKINLLDLLIVLILIGIGVVVFYKMNNSKVISPFAQKDKIETVIFLEEVLGGAADSIIVGEPVRDRASGALIGYVTNYEKGPSVNFATSSDGQLVKTTKEGYNSVRVTIVGTGVYSDSRVVFDNNDYYINKQFEFLVGNTYLYAKIESMTKVEE